MNFMEELNIFVSLEALESGLKSTTFKILEESKPRIRKSPPNFGQIRNPEFGIHTELRWPMWLLIESAVLLIETRIELNRSKGMGSCFSKKSEYSKIEENKKEKKVTPITISNIGIDHIDRAFKNIAEPFNHILGSKERLEKALKSFKLIFKKDENNTLKDCFKELKKTKVKNLRPRLVLRNGRYHIEFAFKAAVEFLKNVQKTFNDLASALKETSDIITSTISSVTDLIAQREEYLKDIKDFFSGFQFFSAVKAGKNAITNFKELIKTRDILQVFKKEVKEMFEEIQECAAFLLEGSGEKGHIMLLYQDWSSSEGGLSTFYRELAIHLAEYGGSHDWRVSCMLNDVTQDDIEKAGKDMCVEIMACSELGDGDALSQCFEDSVLKLSAEDRPTVIVGHSIATGVAARGVQRKLNCRRLQFLHASPKNLGDINRRESSDEVDGLEMLDVCKEKDVTVVAVGQHIRDLYSKELQVHQKEVFDYTPGLNRQLEAWEPDEDDPDPLRCNVTISCSVDEDWGVNQTDMASAALAWLTQNDRPVVDKIDLTYIGAAGTQQDIKEWVLRETKITADNLHFTSFADQEGVAQTLKSADLLLVPSSVNGFSLIALEAISATVMVLISQENGLALAMEKANIGHDNIIESNDPRFWAERIEAILRKPRKHRVRDAENLRGDYAEAYAWPETCQLLESMFLDKSTETEIESVTQDSSEIEVVVENERSEEN